MYVCALTLPKCSSEQSVHLKNCIESLFVLLFGPHVLNRTGTLAFIPYLMHQKKHIPFYSLDSIASARVLDICSAGLCDSRRAEGGVAVATCANSTA